MTLDELDKALQAHGWARISRHSWSRPPQLITLTQGRPVDPWELKTLTGVSPITREYFADARDVLDALMTTWAVEVGDEEHTYVYRATDEDDAYQAYRENNPFYAPREDVHIYHVGDDK